MQIVFGGGQVFVSQKLLQYVKVAPGSQETGREDMPGAVEGRPVTRFIGTSVEAQFGDDAARQPRYVVGSAMGVADAGKKVFPAHGGDSPYQTWAG